MSLTAEVTTPLPGLILTGAALVVAGWATANIWQVYWLKRLRARNLRIVADVRRLTAWMPPAQPREPGNWHPRPGTMPAAAGERPMPRHRMAGRSRGTNLLIVVLTLAMLYVRLSASAAGALARRWPRTYRAGALAWVTARTVRHERTSP